MLADNMAMENGNVKHDRKDEDCRDWEVLRELCTFK